MVGEERKEIESEGIVDERKVVDERKEIEGRKEAEKERARGERKDGKENEGEKRKDELKKEEKSEDWEEGGGGVEKKFLGIHIVAELYGCGENLDNRVLIKKILLEAARKSNATIIDCVVKKFYPQGVSGVVIVAESHISIHTWPEFKYAAVDVYTCGDTDPQKAIEYIVEELKPEKPVIFKFERGYVEDRKEDRRKGGGRKIEKKYTKPEIQVLF